MKIKAENLYFKLFYYVFENQQIESKLQIYLIFNVQIRNVLITNYMFFFKSFSFIINEDTRLVFYSVLVNVNFFFYI